MHTSSIMEALLVTPRELVALVGGGGKTGLMRALFQEARAAGMRTAATTTTRVAAAEAEAVGKLYNWGFQEAGFEYLSRPPIEGLFVGGLGAGPGKISGISPEAADWLYSECPLDCLIVEADGAAGRPLKAPARHEPVIPSSATLVVAVMGLEVVGRPMTAESVFRMKMVEAVTGLKCGDVITPESLVPLFLSRSGLFKGCPAGARKAVLLNKADLLSDAGAAVSFAEAVLSSAAGDIERVVAGSVAGMSFEVFISDGGFREHLH